MTGPLWLHAALASLMIVIAADCAIRLGTVRLGTVRLGRVRIGVRRGVIQRSERGSRPRWTSVDVDGLHVLMGVAMAGMLLPQSRILPANVWEAVFGLGVLWFGWRTIATRSTGFRPSGSLGCLAGGAPLAHVIECLAMIFMLLPAVDDAAGRFHPAGQIMAGMSRTGLKLLLTVTPAVALILVLCLVGYVVWTTDTLASTRSAARAVGGCPVGDASVAGMSVAGASVAGAAGPGAAAGPTGTAGVGVIAGGLLAPRLAALSTIAMAFTMGYMLVQMA